MSGTEPIPDDELVLRHIPGGATWQAPPNGRISSVNFRLRPSESGFSVSRAVITSPAQLIVRIGDPVGGSRVAAALVADVRALGFDVVPVPLAVDSGHAEIRPVSANVADKAVQRALASAFHYV